MSRPTPTLRLWLILILALCSVAACGPAGSSQPSLTTDTRSSTLPTDADKIAFLERYMKFASPVDDTEFHIVYHDNSGGFAPGPSDWNIEAIVKVAPADVGRWSDGMQPLEATAVDLAWADALIAQSGWTVSTPPRVGERAGEITASYDADGVVARKMTTLP